MNSSGNEQRVAQHDNNEISFSDLRRRQGYLVVYHCHSRDEYMMDSSTSTSSPGSTKRPFLLTVEQLTDVRDTLKGPPLTHRSVLIPFGRKAFVPGRLLPLRKEELTSTSNADWDSAATVSNTTQDEIAKNQEYVVVHTVAPRHKNNDTINDTTIEMTSGTGSSAQMTRQEALEYLQHEIDNLKKSKKLTRQMPTVTNKTPASHVPAKTTGNSVPQPTSDDNTADVLPYIEIREELDDTGNIVAAHAVNVTKHLDFLSQQSASKDTNRAGEPEAMDAVPIRPLKETSATTLDDVNDDDHDMGTATETIPPKPEHAKTTDEQHDNISRRLEELMLLEEQHAHRSNTFSTSAILKTKTIPQSSSKKNQGWAKGFLNQPTKPKSTTTKKQAVIPTTSTASLKASSTTISPTISGSSRKDTTVTSISRLSSTVNDMPNNPKKVSFTDQDDVQVIPRIGQRSIASEQPAPFARPIQGTLPPLSSVDRDTAGAVAAQVVERKQPNGTRRRPVPTTTTATMGPNVPRDSTTSINTAAALSSEPKKKLSKFAQERQQLRN